MADVNHDLRIVPPQHKIACLACGEEDGRVKFGALYCADCCQTDAVTAVITPE